jgi:hypothetical protein
MCEPRRGVRVEARTTGLWVLAAFGAAGVLRVMETAAGWASLVMPAVWAVLIVGVVVVPMVVRHRRVVRRSSRQAPSAVVRVTAGPVPVRAVLLDDPKYLDGAVDDQRPAIEGDRIWTSDNLLAADSAPAVPDGGAL